MTKSNNTKAADENPGDARTEDVRTEGVLCPTCGAMLDENHAHKLADGTVEGNTEDTGNDE